MSSWDVPVKLAHLYVKVAHLCLSLEPFPDLSLHSFPQTSLSSIFQWAEAGLSDLPCLLQITLMALVAAMG